MQPTGSPTLCSHCGARLRAGLPGEVLRCEYCGTETRVPVPVVAFRGAPVQPPPQAASGSAAGVALAGAVVTVVAMTGVSIAVFSASRASPQPVRVDVPSMPAFPAVPPPNEKRSPADYFGEPGGIHGWALLDVRAPGAASDFDPTAAVPWATTLAKQWKPDAELARIDAEALDETGRLDLTATKETKATFRFWSPQAFADYEKSPSPSSTARYEVEMFLEVSGEGVKALRLALPSPRKSNGVEVPKSCTLKQAVDALRAKRKLPDRHAYYSAYLIDVASTPKRGEPSWYFNPTNHAFSLPPVDARTCKVK
jgi:hypothetical protein